MGDVDATSGAAGLGRRGEEGVWEEKAAEQNVHTNLE